MSASTSVRAPRRALRPLLVAVIALFGLTALGCHDRRRNFDDDPEIFVTVHNEHGHSITIELVANHGLIFDLGRIGDGNTVTFGLDDSFTGERLRAICNHDGEVVDVEFAFDGLHWDVF